ncbi:MAG TPA: cytochrome c oxidase subunit II [Gaiellaceae bacterium]|nr:cytochrome c oxidase subunit II [Gaiellaceae bacterium]
MTRLGDFGRIAVIWLVTSTVGMVLVATVLAPHLPPGGASTEASGQRFDNEVLTLVSVPIVAMIVVYFGYVLIAFREREPSVLADGPPIRGHMRTQTIWIVVTTLTVLFLAAFGTYELLGGSGGGQGPNPAFVPAAQTTAAGVKREPLQVQVIGQQWQFTFRYPSFGGFETAQLVLPVDRQIELHVTSLDVIHSFWAYKLGVKADANPGVDNIAYVTPKHLGSFDLRCAELCGLFHGYMFDTGRVVSGADFAKWVAGQRAFMQPVLKYLPPFEHSYLPEPTIRGG